jgi:hypothetical protein
MGVSVDATGFLFGDDASPESVTGVAGPVLLAATVPDLSRGDVLAGRYQIEAVIGSGGSGRVLRAFDRVTRSPVALKILRSEFASDPVWTERFSRELRVGRQIQHPNVCRVYDIGEADGHRFLSMELATGGTLRSQMEPGAKPRSVDDRIADARAIIQGVAALHSAGIVHRDLKPENILRTADGRLLVSDFGLATDPGAGPATTVMIGTPRYMAPEVVMGDPATVRSDVWALGVVMHEVLSGERPNRSIIKRRRRMYTPPEVGSVRERRLVELCARCSEEDPAERPASAVELRREFEAAAAGRRFGNRALKKQIAWGAVALVAIASLGIVRDRWTSSAVASSSQAVSGAYATAPALSGVAKDFSEGSKNLGAFAGKVHCVAVMGGGRTARVVWGNPRKAEDIDLGSGVRKDANVHPDAFALGCPQWSANGRLMLFETTTPNGRFVSLSDSADGKHSRQLVRGTSPSWLPNGQEFIVTVDSRHAGMFSLPTGELNIIGSEGAKPRLLEETAVAPSGTRLAIRYTTESLENVVVIHELPGLGEMARMHLPKSARHIRFGNKADTLWAGIDGPQGDIQLAEIDWRRGVMSRVGEVPGADVADALPAGAQTLVVVRRMAKDLWATDTGGNTRLTNDGHLYSGSLSVAGVVAAQRLLPNGRYVIVVRQPLGREDRLTDGPLDVTPTFSPDGRRLMFARLESKDLVECNVEGPRDCHSVHRDPLLPGFPSIDPSGRQVAYLTLMNTPRVRVVPSGGGVSRDLGPAGGDSCSPYWSSADRLWVAQPAVNGQMSWAEIDVTHGTRTGQSLAADVPSSLNCAIPSQIAASPDRVARVSVSSIETSDLFARLP